MTFAADKHPPVQIEPGTCKLHAPGFSLNTGVSPLTVQAGGPAIGSGIMNALVSYQGDILSYGRLIRLIKPIDLCAVAFNRDGITGP